jgi:hypothetical protein
MHHKPYTYHTVPTGSRYGMRRVVRGPAPTGLLAPATPGHYMLATVLLHVVALLAY